VPVNPNRLNDPENDMIWVSLAGPLSNFMLAIMAASGMWFLRNFAFIPESVSMSLYTLLKFVLLINVILPVFNLFPVPPLDGSKVLMGILPRQLSYEYSKLEPYGFIIILVLLMSNIFWVILGPVANIIIKLLGG
jgi:Zn-dependent protease